MRILLVSSEFPPGPGGIGTHAYQLARHLQQSGWEILVLAAQDYAPAAEVRAFNEAQPFPVVSFRSMPVAPLKAAYRSWQLSQSLKKWRPTLLVASGKRSAWLAAWVNRRRELPWVAIGHGTEFNEPAGWSRDLTRWSFRQATTVVCVSDYTRRQMLQSGIRPRRDLVIPNGADVNQFRVLPSKEMESFHIDSSFNGARLLLTVGHVSERKGQDIVIRALPHILREAPATHYLVIGLPSKKREFMELAMRLGVEKHVHFLGRVDADSLVKYLNRCDVFVMTSRHTQNGDFEGYGIAVVEAALCGKPAVVSANSGLVEAIRDGETGIAVAEADETATAKAVLTLLSDDCRRRRMGEAARGRAIAEQSWSHRVNEYDALFRSLLPV